jgi:hypothetical protein
MGKSTAGSPESANEIVTGSLTSATAGNWAVIGGNFNIAVWGVFVGTVVIEKSYDGTTTSVPVSKDTSGTPATFTSPFSVYVREPEQGCNYRVNCTAFTSGTISYRISQ